MSTSVAIRDDLVTVGPEELLVDSVVRTAIYDESGVLLLAEGTELTSEVRRKLLERRRPICLPRDEADRVTMRSIAVPSPPTLALGEEVAKRIEAVLESGLIPVENTGPSVREDRVMLGCQGYDQHRRSELQEKHRQNSTALSQMMGEALDGNEMDGSIVSAMAAGYLKDMTDDGDNALTSTIDAFTEDDLSSRSIESALLAMAIGIEMDFDADNVRILGIAGLVHDWGMISVPPEIRNKPAKLTPVEWLEVQKHPIRSLSMLEKVQAIPPLVPIVVYQVHERFNGTGYPRGRCGASIPIFSRILAVADAFVALTSPRPHRPPLMRYAAMEVLLRSAQKRAFDPDVVEAMLQIQSLFPIGSLVLLSDNSVAVVHRANRNVFTKPIVRIVRDGDGRPVEDERIIDLSDSEVGVKQALPTPGSNEIAVRDSVL